MGSVQTRANRIHTVAGKPLRILSSAALLAALGLLAGCTTPQERATRNQAEVERMMAEYGPACERLGYAPNSDPWRSCVLKLNERDDLLRYPPDYYGGWGPGWRGRGWWGPGW